MSLKNHIDKLRATVERRQSGIVAAVFLVAAASLLNNALSAPLDDAGPDGLKYELMGHRAAESKHLLGCNNFDHAYWSPGWVATIGATYRLAGRKPNAIRIVLVLIALASALIVYLLARRLVTPVAAVFAPALLLFSELVFRFTTYFQYEMLLAFLLLVFVLLLSGEQPSPATWKNQTRLLAAGLVLGLAALVSPRVLVAIAIAAFTFYRRGHVRQATRDLGLLAIGLSIVLGAWTVRNVKCFSERIATTTNGGINLYIGNNALSTGGYYLPPEDQRPNYPLWASHEWRREALIYVRDHPWQTVGRTIAKGARFWNPHYGDQFLLMLLYIIGWVRLVRWRDRPWDAARSWVLWTPFLFTAVHMIFFVQPRYMIPVLPFVAIVAGAGVAGWRSDRSSDESSDGEILSSKRGHGRND